MRSYRKKLTCTLIVVAILIAIMSIAYASLSTTLTITGNAEVQASTWDIYFMDGQITTTGSAKYTEPVIDGTRLRDYTVSLKKPGDSVTFIYHIYNNGDYSAQIDAILNSTPICTSSTGNEEDEKSICDNLNIDFDLNGAQIGDIIGSSKNFGPVLCKNGETTTVIRSTASITIALNNTSDVIVGSDVTISNLKNEIVLSMSNAACNFFQCFVAGTKVLTSEGYTNIEDIKVGDKVYSINAHGVRELKEVSYKYNKFTQNLQKIRIGKETIEVTPEHRIYVIGKGYIRADEIQKRDRLYGIKDGFVISNDGYTYKATIPVYNMEVDDNHNYLVTESEFLVHNAYA